MKMIKCFFVLILIGFIFSGANYPNSKIFALEAGGGGGGSGGFGGGGGGGGFGGEIGGGIGVGGAAGIAGLAISAMSAMSKGCGVGNGPNAFGGKIQKVCPCKFPPVGQIVIVGSPKGGHFYFGPGSRAFLFGKILPGVWSLGVSGTVVTCFESLKPPKPMSGSKIMMIGTSLF